MNSTHYSNHNRGSSSLSDDDDIVFQDGYQDNDNDDDVEMSYFHTGINNAPSDSTGYYYAVEHSTNQNNNAQNAHNANNTYGDNDFDNNINNANGNKNTTTNNKSSASGMNQDQAAEPRVRKKPGRKPGPSCPALRKEQNRAAQRAFRDRKERHLHQLENMIKDLKNQHYLVTSQLQREAHQLKAVIESLQSENYYLREVVFAFESALSKGNHIAVLKDVKQELFRRHHESRAAAATAMAAKSTQSSHESSAQATITDIPATPTTPGTLATPIMTLSSNSLKTTTGAPTTPRSSSARSVSPSVTVKASPSPSLSSISVASPSPAIVESNSQADSMVARMDTGDKHNSHQGNNIDLLSEEGIYSISGDILYKAPPLFIPDISGDGKLEPPVSPFGPLSVPRPTYRPPGTNLPQHTDYMKHPTVFDELQSSLFPPGTLESLHISMATPQEVVSDESLFAEPEMAEEKSQGYMSEDKKNGAQVANLANGRTSNSDYDDDDEAEELSKVAAALGMKWQSFPKHRLHKELRILLAAKPQTDPNIDPKVYEVPHDPRIDYIPCPKLRAQMIVHQHRYNADEVFQLLLDQAVCWGEPLHKDSWQLPDAFFDRFGFLLGIELERIRNKTYPPQRRQ
ncbi:hypothetical protein BGX28_003451 [Mortierella sp. GBA30]|nr:hypothetical protein BGX28_003451 [Mortierella sp. GBA30]